MEDHGGEVRLENDAAGGARITLVFAARSADADVADASGSAAGAATG
jgi:hypothetical protein